MVILLSSNCMLSHFTHSCPVFVPTVLYRMFLLKELSCKTHTNGPQKHIDSSKDAEGCLFLLSNIADFKGEFWL